MGVVALLAVLLAVTPAGAQAPAPSVGRPVRNVMATGRLASVVDTPVHFKLLRVTIPPGQSAPYSGPSGMLWVNSGVLGVGVDGERRSLEHGSAVFVTAGQRVTLTASAGAPAVALHFVLAPASQLDTTGHARPTMTTELYRTRDPVPNLKPGAHEFTLIRVSVDKGVPRPPMHQRSGAALYYVLSGTWTLHMDGRTEARRRGDVQFEPNGFVHTWENVGDSTGVLIQANVSLEGAPEILFLPPR